MGEKSLHILARHANSLEDVETAGKNDPLVVVTLDLEDKPSWKKSSVKNNAGTNVEWDEVLVLDNYDHSRHHNLYVDVLDKEKTANAVIGYCTIPLHQVIDAGGQLKAKFDLYNKDGKEKGTISLTLTIVNTSESGDNHDNDGPESKGLSTNDQKHQDHIKSLVLKEHGADAAALLGVAGALFLAGSAMRSKPKKEKN
ncbi:hypothetical protein BGZ65_006781 [Modicella reniformis]|uniref:C2 domain-containing protein n=1 Tax=Modicella reniformis TaxID=1440133 RepID=A0A9P6IN65_9FUNG|nr:hypothetical protein BGZ65_006781 [Modicella reniformis]